MAKSRGLFPCPRPRGVNPGLNTDTRKLLEKARRAIQAAVTLLQHGDADFAAGRAYYAMFYTAEALLSEKGFHPANTAAFTPSLESISPKPESWKQNITGFCWTLMTGDFRPTTALRPSSARKKPPEQLNKPETF